MHFEVEILVQPKEDELDDGYRTLSIPLKINGEEIFNALKIGSEAHSHLFRIFFLYYMSEHLYM